MTTSDIQQQAIAAFESALSSPSSGLSGLGASIYQERDVIEDRHADIENALARTYCADGDWDKGWSLVKKRVSNHFCRALWEKQIRKDILADRTLHTTPM